MQNKKEETKKQSERDTLEYRNRMKNTQLEIRYWTAENLLWVDNDNRLYAEHRKSLQNREKVYGMRKNYTEFRTVDRMKMI